MNTIKVQIKTIFLENCKYDIDLYNALTKELQNDTIVSYVLSPSKIFAYVQTTEDFGITIESNGVFHHIDDIYNKFLVDFPNVLLETLKYDDIAVEIIHSDEDEPVLPTHPGSPAHPLHDQWMQFCDEQYPMEELGREHFYSSLSEFNKIFDEDFDIEKINKKVEELEKHNSMIVEKYVGKRVPLTNISVNNGTVMIFEEDNNIVLLQDTYELGYDEDSFSFRDGTVEIIRTEKLNKNFLPIDEELQSLTKIFGYEIFGTQIAQAEEYARMCTEKNTINLMSNIINSFDAIENDEPYDKPETTIHRDRNVQAMKEVLESMYDMGETLTMKEAAQGTECVSIEEVKNSTTYSELDVDDLAAYSIGDTIQETVELKVTLISVSSFDEYASKHNIVGWDISTPSTILIKYMEDGVTSEEKIKKFHDMMESLDTGWVDKTSFDVKYLSELHQVFERDLTEEFLARVKKHNVFVRENLAKIRSALLDMEKDYEELKDEVNLTIDWENLTAFASKKERIEHRTKGVDFASKHDGIVSVNSILPPSNLVKVSTGLVEGDFYIPEHLVTNELRSKYVIDDRFVYHINDVPDFAFYEVIVNDHVMLIEKTDL